MPIITKAMSKFGTGIAFDGGPGPDSLTVNADAFLVSTDSNGVEVDEAWNVTINGIVGTFNAGAAAILFGGNGSGVSTLKVGSGGNIFGGTYGVLVNAGDPVKITNKGSISGVFGISAAPADSSAPYSITNSGVINAVNTGLDLSGDGIRTVTNSGTISAPNAITTFDNGIDKITNSGKITGDIDLGNGDDSIVNRGTITGDIDLGDSQDIFTNFQIVRGVIKSGTVIGDIELGEGDDKFFGGSKGETVRDGDGADSYKFGGGNDIFLAMPADLSADGFDAADGGAGIDTYDASADVTDLFLNLDKVDHEDFNGIGNSANQAFSSGVESDAVFGFENANGGSGSDLIFGSAAVNKILGNADDDELWGFGGNDILDGGSEDDLLTGGAGRDTLTGGVGIDTFNYGSVTDSGIGASKRDLITDFFQGADFIRLTDIDADKTTAGDQDFTLVASMDGAGFFTKTAGELRFRYEAGNTILEGDVNGDAKADFQIALAGHFNLTGADVVE
jgi:Ca2+-binding RTX toxin-like protein